MKRFFGLMLCLCAVAFTACNDDKTDDTNKWFKQPQVGNVSGTTAVVVCTTSFGDNVLASGTPGFAYAPIVDSGLGEYLLAGDVTVEGSVITCRLSGLSPQTTYVGHAFVNIGGQQFESKAIAFQTEAMGEEDRGIPVFGTPDFSDVTSSSATISGSFTYDGDKTVSEVYFSYAAAGSAAQRAAVSTATGDKSASLTSLSESTTYTFSLCVVVDGQTYKSAAKSFTTPATGGVTPPPASGDTKYSGWAELPVEVASSDYHYAYHLCPDFKVAGRQARNFTVCYSAKDHCPVWVAAPRHACYEVKGTERTDAYGKDPAILSSIQYNSQSTGGGCNKGHMLGSAERLVTRATNKQVFYYTNIAPQYSDNFNNGGGAWNNLEGFVDKQVCADTTYIVVGTYFKTFTDAYGKSCNPATISYGGRSDVTRPSMFYYLILRTKNGNTKKAIADCTASELKCAAFVLRHNMEKGHVPQAKDMMKVSDVEKLVGFTFFSNVPNAPKDSYNPADWGL